MGDAAVNYGISREVAYKLAAQSILGSAKMVLETGENPKKLRENVCSPGGTTIKAVNCLEEMGFAAAIIEAMNKCTDRANEMSTK